MKIQMKEGLPFVPATVVFRGRGGTLANMLLDTGSAGTLLSADRLLDIGVQFEPADPVRRIRGVGGAEFVFVKRVEHIAVGELMAGDFSIEVGAMDYGFELDGIIGNDFLVQVGAVIDLAKFEIKAAPSAPR